MKARLKATGDIIEVMYSHQNKGDGNLWYATSRGTCFSKKELEFIETGESLDYWTKLEHQYAGMAMQGLMSNIEQMIPRNGHSLCDEIVDISVEVAHALVEKFKKEEK